MNVEKFPDRTISVDNEEYLYFGGTNYLGMATNVDFQNCLIKSIQQWGTAYGSSRNSNVKLSIYEEAEALFAKNRGTEAALTVSSGMLAGKFVIEYLSKTTDALFHFPDTHPALMNSSSLPIVINGKLNAKIFDSTISKITILTDSIPGFCVTPIDLNILLEIPNNKEIFLVIDESHSIGLIDNTWYQYLIKDTIKIIKIASLGKAFGLTGGVIAGHSTFISEIKKQNTFIGASGMNPSYLDTFCNAQELYIRQKTILQQNLNYFETHFFNRKGFTFNVNYPVIYFENESVYKKLLKNKIIISSFKYTSNSKILNRIVINANHSIQDLKKLLLVLNSDY